jgi:hypothetical protein
MTFRVHEMTMRTRTPSIRQAETRRNERRQAHAPRRGAEDRVRQAGGPQDTAFYRCDCGYSFDGVVSTHVACPHCGTDQSW